VLQHRGEPTDHRVGDSPRIIAKTRRITKRTKHGVYKKLFVIFAGLHGFVKKGFLQLGMLQVKIGFCLERMCEQQDFLITEKLARQVQRGW
jgi:hypothetical protein